jgi:hypothetical protein
MFTHGKRVTKGGKREREGGEREGGDKGGGR